MAEPPVALQDLNSALKEVASGKTVTNRRASLQTLRMLLETERVQVLINQATENRHAEMLDDAVITWPRVIDAVLQMVDKEIEHLRSKAPEAKKPRTAKTQEDVAGTLRAILKLADRESLLRPSLPELLRHIAKVLKDENLHQAFLNEYCHILSDIVLVKPSYCQSLTLPVVFSILRSYLSILESPNAENRIAQDVHRLIAAYPFDLDVASLPPNFLALLRTPRYAPSLLAALNHILLRQALDLRPQIRDAGKQLNDSMISLWNSKEATDLRALRRDILLLWRIQVRACIGWSGEYSDIAGRAEIYREVIVKELGNANSVYLPARRRERKECGEEYLDEDAMSFVDLAADVFYLALSLSSSEEQPAAGDGAQPVKRQRSSSALDALLAACASDDSPALQLWLALLFSLCSKHPHAVSSGTYQQAIGVCAKHLEKRAVRVGVDVWSLRALTALASLSPLLAPEPKAANRIRESIAGELWMPVWGAVVRKIGFRQAPIVEHSFVLLRTLLAYELVEAKAALAALDDAWKVVTEEARFVTAPALELLSLLIAKVELAPALRTTLVTWLLSAIAADSAPRAASPHVLSTELAAPLVAVLIGLVRSGPHTPLAAAPVSAPASMRALVIPPKPASTVEAQLDDMVPNARAEHLRCHSLSVEASAPNKVPSQVRAELVGLIGKRLRHKAAALESESAEAIARQKKTTGPDAAALRNQLTLVLSFAHVLSVVIARVPLPRDYAVELRESLKRLTDVLGRETEKLSHDAGRLEAVLHSIHSLLKTWVPMAPRPDVAHLTPLSDFLMRFLTSSLSALPRHTELGADDDDIAPNVVVIIAAQEPVISAAFELLALLLSLVADPRPQHVVDVFRTIQSSGTPNLRLRVLNAVLDIPHFSAEEKASLVFAQINDPRLIRSDHPAVLRGLLTLLSRAAGVLSKTKDAPAFQSALKAIAFFEALLQEGRLDVESRLAFAAMAHAFIPMIPTGEKLFQVAFLFTSLLQDAHFRVRRAVAESVVVLFEVFESPFADIRSKLAPAIEHTRVAEWSAAACVTAIDALVAIARHSRDHEKPILLLLCETHSRLEPADVRQYLRRGLEGLAAHFGYANLNAYTEDNLRFLLHMWTQSGRALDAFPMQYCDCASLAVFCTRYARLLVPCYFMRRDEAMLRELGRVLGKPIKELLRDAFGGVFGQAFPRCTSQQAEARKEGVALVTHFLQKFLPENEVNELVVRFLDEVLLEWVDIAALPGSDGEAEAEPEMLSLEDIRRALEHVAQSATHSVGGLLITTRERPAKLIVNLSMRFAAAHRERERRRLFHVICFFLRLMQEKLAATRPSLFRDIIHLLLRVVRDAALRSPACAMLREVCEWAVRPDPGAVAGHTKASEELARHVSVIVYTLVETSLESLESSPPAPLTDLLRYLATCPAPPVRAAIARFDPPFPAAPEYRELALLYEGKRGSGSSLQAHIQRFLDADALHTSTATLCIILERLRMRLAQHKDALLDAVSSGASLGQDVSRLARRLLAVSKAQEDERIRVVVAAVLGELPLDPLLLHVHSDRVAAGAAGADGAQSGTLPERRERAQTQALKLLTSYLVHPNVQLMAYAYVTLRELLTEGGPATALYDALDDVTKAYLKTFQSTKKSKPPFGLNPLPKVDALASLSVAESGLSYATWISRVSYGIASSLVSDPFYRACAPVCYLQAEFAEFLFPHLMADLLLRPQGVDLRRVGGQIAQHVLHAARATSTVNQATQLVLSTLNMLRDLLAVQANRTAGERAFFVHEVGLGIDFLDLARAALRCNAPLTALLWLELLCENARRGDRLALPDHPELSHTVEELMLEAYTTIDEPDAVYGLPHPDQLAARLRMYEHENDWPRALGGYNMLLQANAAAALTAAPGTKGLLSSLHHLGYHHILDRYLRGALAAQADAQPELMQFLYQTAWRTGQWSADVTANPLDTREEIGFHATVYHALRALHDGDAANFGRMLSRGRSELAQALARMSMESSKDVYPTICMLQELAEVEEAWNLAHPANDDMRGTLPTQARPRRVSDGELRGLEHAWAGRLRLMRNERFELVEPFLALRHVLMAELSEGGPWKTQQLLALASVARKAKRPQIAAQAIYQLSRSSSPSSSPSPLAGRDSEAQRWRLAEAKLLWEQKETVQAVAIARSVVQSLSAAEGASPLLCSALLCAGRWLAESRSASSSVVRKEYLERAVKVTKDTRGSATKAHFTLALYEESLYHNVASQARSQEWQQLRQFKRDELAAVEQQLKALAADRGQRAELQRTQEVLEKQVSQDNTDLERMEEDRKTFLLSALTNYVLTLVSDNKYDVRAVFRLVSLWFDNMSHAFVNAHLEASLASVPAHKFLPLFYQIVSRLSHAAERAPDGFQRLLRQTIERVAQRHPHHSLFQLFALKNGGKSSLEQPVNEDKVKAASAVLARLTRVEPELCTQMERLSAAYIELAFLDVSSHKTNTQKAIALPKTLLITTIRDLLRVAVPTCNVPVAPDGNYRNVPSVKEFEPSYQLAGGLNLPKIVQCIGTDGHRYRQLVKGKDDLRQDAVMQQIFGLVNSFLAEDGETRKRRLSIRSYKVIPLTPTAGLLEWVSNTTPLGEWLVGTPANPSIGAHVRYRPKDKSNRNCRHELGNAKDAQKLEAFENICREFKPVFHHFFLELSGDPAKWWETRLAYTRSAAVSSIVGYVVGLGDRHSQNILIDKSTAEFVHIDLGVAFEQGRMLRTPEVVPFRLTRDIEDGMGVTGVEGVFRRCCEETMRVLRRNQDAILTVIGVLIHDPLHRWGVSPLRALKTQVEDNEAGWRVPQAAGPAEMTSSKEAERALLRVRQKLSQTEYGEALSVGGQVEILINEARDPERLCRMFPGWAPWV